MTEIILRELNNSDIDWMTLAGQKVAVAAGDRLPPGNTQSQQFYLVLEGEFELVLPNSDRANSAIVTYSSGDIAGFSFLQSSCLPAVIRALEPSLVLAIDHQALMEKLQRDASFSTRFYRAIAMLLSHKRWQIASSILNATAVKPNQASNQKPSLETTDLETTENRLLLFSFLHDSDLCWMIKVGKVTSLKANEVYLREGQPLETLDIVLEGNLLMLICHGRRNALPLAFGVSHHHQPQNIAQALPGDMLGVTAFLDMTPNLYLLKAAQETRLLSIPIDSLLPRFQADVGFADRFHHALANLMVERLCQVINHLGGSMPIYEPGCSLCDNSAYEGELTMAALQQLSVARTKFNWLLQQLGVKNRA